MDDLTIPEKDAMTALWKIGRGTARQILESHDNPLPHYNTLRSSLENLKQKKYLEIRPVGNTNEYIPLIKLTKYKKHHLSEFVKNHFDNSYKKLVTFFAEESKLTEKDLEEIRDIIKNKRSQ